MTEDGGRRTGWEWHFPVVKAGKVHDGDSFKLLLDMGFSVEAEQPVRLEGVDAPEHRG